MYGVGEWSRPAIFHSSALVGIIVSMDKLELELEAPGVLSQVPCQI